MECAVSDRLSDQSEIGGSERKAFRWSNCIDDSK